MSLTLYYHPLSSFCHKVLMALYELDVAFDARIIDLANDQDRSELRALWPIGKFPVIRDDVRGMTLPESTIIIEYLAHVHEGGRRLIPGDWKQALDVRLWDRFFDQYVHSPMQRIVGDKIRAEGQHDAAGVADARAMLETAYAMIDERMSTRTWAAGESFSMADCAASPALFYAGIVQPLPQRLVNATAYFDRLSNTPAFQRVIEQARPYFPMFPFVEAIPERFRSTVRT